MKCYRVDLRRKYASYIHGLLPVLMAKKVEMHLAACSACNGLVERMKTVERLISELPSVSPNRNLWSKIEAALPQRAPLSNYAPLWKKVAIVAVFGLISGVLGAVTYGKLSGRSLNINSPVRLEEFSRVPIERIPTNTEPHIVTEGYVSEVRLNGEDGDRMFKLVEDLHRPGPFVICELIDPLDLPAPPVGSHVRVYGVSRYDNQSDHEWHEVHPVLNIEILKK